MTARRLVLVADRFWPLVGGVPRMMAALAVEFLARGRQVTVLTDSWDPAWPARITYQGVPVVRLPYRRASAWGAAGHLFRLLRWLHAQRGRCDLVYASPLGGEALAALYAAPRGAPVVLRAHGAGQGGDCPWRRPVPGLRWMARGWCKAAAIVAPCPAVAEEVRQREYPAERLHEILPGVALPPPISPAARIAARDTLLDAQPMLRLAADAPLAVCTCRLHADRGLYYLLKAWRQVLQRRPQACLWLAGDGPERAALQEQVHSLGLAGRVLLPGTFVQVAELLAAADLFVFPSQQGRLSLSLLEAMAAGLPIVAGDAPGSRAALLDEQHGLLAAPRSSEALAQAMERLLADPPLAARLGAAARRRAQQSFSLARCVDRHLELFDRLTPEDGPASGER